MRVRRRGLLAGLLFAPACVLAVWTHTPGFQARTERTGIQKGSYAVLIPAEEALGHGRPEEALGLFRAAFFRARHMNELPVAERVLRRMGAVGLDEARISFDKGWPFLQQFALLSSDFPGNAALVESKLLEEPSTARQAFVYDCLMPDGRLVWGERPRRELPALWPVYGWCKEILKKSPTSDLFEKGQPDWPQTRYVVGYSLPFKGDRKIFPAVGNVSVQGETIPCSVRWMWLEKLRAAEHKEPGSWTIPGIFATAYAAPQHVILFTDSIRTRVRSIQIVRQYEASE